MTMSKIMETGKRSLLTYQSAISTTSQNISNVNNPEYSRRRVDFTSLSGGLTGLGVTLDENIRLRQRFAEHQLWTENQQLGMYDAYQSMFTQIEDIFASGTGADLNSALSEFWDSWSDLANDPESSYARTIVRDKGQILVNAFNRQHTDLVNLQNQIEPEIGTMVDEINGYLKQLQGLNTNIRTSGAAELMDERDRILGELSQMIDIKVKEKDNGEVSVSSAGLLLVSADKYMELEARHADGSGSGPMQIYYKNSTQQVAVSSGSVYARLDTYNNRIPEYLDKLDDLAVELAEQVNTLHFNAENNTGITNIYFFSGTVSGAADLTLDGAVAADPGLIATRAAGEGEGSGSVAQAISDLQFSNTISNTTFASYFNSMLVGIGSHLQESQDMYSSQKLIISQLQNFRDETAGVSLDEEMTRLIQYENAYQAAAKVVTTVDQMIQAVLAMK